jgi:hypothetical protein
MRLRKCKKLSGVFYCYKRILKFPEREDIVSDEDIFDLFKGLITLVKRNAEIKVEQKYEVLIDVLKSELREYKQNN